MPITSGMTVVFRAAAGPRLGFGHLVRCRSLARALGVTPRVWIRGSAATKSAARSLGCEVLPEALSLRDAGPSPLLVVDDPSPPAAAAWVRRARALDVPVCTIHDAGRPRVAADLLVDGSVGVTPSTDPAQLLGPAYAMLDPGIKARRRTRRVPGASRVCIALGGGAHVFTMVPRLVAALAALVPGADIRVARGFVSRCRLPALAAGHWIAPQLLADTLAAADVAIVAGGVTAYEACALGVPLVAVAVTFTQQGTVGTLERLGAAIDGGLLCDQAAAVRVAEKTAGLLAAPATRRHLAATGFALIDGDGVGRVAASLRTLQARAAALHGVTHAA
ncbi:MAG: hypothetical protein ABI880_13925 [Acidobacteriota bacterium]